jgi:spore cortex biosynthesis protein YabQ
VSLQVQFLTIGVMMASGAAMGILFDIYRVLAGQLRLPRLLVPAADLLYWAAATLLVFRNLLFSNHGELRFFVFIGLAAGISFHFCFMSPATVKTVKAFIRFAVRAYFFLVKCVNIFLVRPVKLLFRITVIFTGFLAALAIFLYKFVLQLIYPVKLLLRWLFTPLLRRMAWPHWMEGAGRKLAGILRRLWK